MEEIYVVLIELESFVVEEVVGCQYMDGDLMDLKGVIEVMDDVLVCDDCEVWVEVDDLFYFEFVWFGGNLCI